MYESPILVICAVLMACSAIVGIPIAVVAALQARPHDPSPERWRWVPDGPLSMVSQVRSSGVKSWGNSVTILPRPQRIRYKLRVENTGSNPLTGLVARAELPESISAVSRKCWLRSEACSGSPVEGGVDLPDLKPGESVVMVFVATVSSEIHGDIYRTWLKVSSNEAGESKQAVSVVVSSSEAESAVRPFVSQVQDTLETGGGQASIAEHSKRLLIGQWPRLTLKHPHPFDRITHARALIDGKPIRVLDLLYERWLEGQIVRLRGRIVRRPVDYRIGAKAVGQMLELGNPGVSARLRCYTPRRADSRLTVGEEVEVKGVIVAWGPEGSPDAALTVAACPSARIVRSVPRLEGARRR
jgi:hypothetical protein